MSYIVSQKEGSLFMFFLVSKREVSIFMSFTKGRLPFYVLLTYFIYLKL
jgi:hypothetical protein